MPQQTGAPAASGPDRAAGRAPTSEGDFAAPLRSLLQAVSALGGARAATVRLLHDEESCLHLVGAAGVPPGFDEQLAGVDASCGGCAQAVTENSARDWSGATCACARALSNGTGANDARVRVQAVPLRHHGEACGVLSLFLPPDAAAGQSDISALLPALADLLGLAVETTRRSHQSLHASLTQERHLLASEVHDSLAQNLTSVRMRSAVLRDAIAKNDSARAFGYLREIDQSISTMQSRVRELITHFRTQMDPGGLVPALRKTVDELRGVGPMQIDFRSPVRDLALSADDELQVFHIVREALINVIKHSQAAHARISIEPALGGWEIAVEDDGIGLDPSHESRHGHYGLNIMRERARYLGGEIDFDSPRGQGTRLRLRFPASAGCFRSEATL